MRHDSKIPRMTIDPRGMSFRRVPASPNVQIPHPLVVEGRSCSKRGPTSIVLAGLRLRELHPLRHAFSSSTPHAPFRPAESAGPARAERPLAVGPAYSNCQPACAPNRTRNAATIFITVSKLGLPFLVIALYSPWREMPVSLASFDMPPRTRATTPNALSSRKMTSCELPFLHSVGIEPRYKGRAAIAGFTT